MQIIPTHMTVAEYCEAVEAGGIIVNRDYQRSNQVWPATAQSFLVESMLLNFPVPKLALYQRTDRDSRRTYKEIIDGQQRTEAIKSFYDGALRLSRTLESHEAAGRKYEELDSVLKDRFLSYPLGIDLFVDATPADVREVFRRINSYEVPLNPEEQRHAKWQGAFKWFIYHLSARNDQVFLDLGTFGQKQLVRMQDMKLLTEIARALISGISTTNKRSLDALYEENDAEFDSGDELETWIEDALEAIARVESIQGTGVTRPYSLYSLLLAVAHAAHDIPALRQEGVGGRGLVSERDLDAALGVLADALEEKAATGSNSRFVKASTDRTNVAEQRRIRFQTYLEAVQA